MSKTLTLKEALEQGYFYFYYGDKTEYNPLYSIDGITEADFKEGPLFLAEKESYHTPSISAEEISELLADRVAEWNNENTGDDTDDVYDTVKALDFTDAAERINNALVKKKYYQLTDIQLLP